MAKVYFFVLLSAQYADRISVYYGGMRFNNVTRANTGDYDIELYGNGGYAEKTIKLTVLGKFNFCIQFVLDAHKYCFKKIL